MTRPLSQAKSGVKWALRKLGYDLVKSGFPVDFSPQHLEIMERVRPFTITSNERIFSLIESVRHVLKRGIAGDIVECGVYKGGSMMAVALTLAQESVTDRNLYLYDTFEGMPKPGVEDVDAWGEPASKSFEQMRRSEKSSSWVNCSMEAVRAAMLSTNYPEDRIHLIKGLVEETLPPGNSSPIALLRLDTDWYRSTLHELNTLYPLVAEGGIVLIDDYGHYAGAKQAVDEFFSQRKESPFLHRVDYTCRLLIKQSS